MVKENAAAVAVGRPMEATDQLGQSRSALRLAIRALLRRPPALVGLFCCTVVVICALIPGLLSPADPLEQNLERYLKTPGYVDARGKTYWLGTDQQGRDVLSRVIWGSRISLIVGVTTVVVSGLIGVFLGILAGYKGGWIDAVISRIIDTLLAVPFILLAMSLVAILGASLQNIILAIALRTWIIYARVVRGEALSLRAQDFVSGAKAIGCGTTRLLMVYILPNVISSTIVVATLNLGRMIIIESSLSFLGLGVPPPKPTWGGMLAEGRVFLDTAWWIAFFPGMVLMITVLGTNLLGDWLRDILDPRLKRLGD
jgi:peptide/nickel transport system permease protein